MLSPKNTNISLDSVGQLLAQRYSLVSLLGTGGMAKVFEAYDTVLNRIVAVKIMNAGDFSEHRVVRFHRGAKAASAINHPNVATTLDFGLTNDNRPFMVMEMVRGVTLRAIFKSAGAVLPELALQITEQVCQGMALAHKLGIVHRDLTPSNIIVEGLGTSQARAKILDFGIAMITTDEPITKQGTVVGSPVYMSPEQVQGKPLDTRTDVYSIGCLLFEALTGRPAFRGKTPLETMSMHVLEQPPTLKDHWKHTGAFHPDLDRIIAKALAKEPAKRYQSVSEMRADILACMAEKDEKPTEDFSPESFSLAERVTPSPRRSLRLWISGLFISGVLLMVAGLAIMSYVLCQQPGRATQTMAEENLGSLFQAADDAYFSRVKTYTALGKNAHKQLAALQKTRAKPKRLVVAQTWLTSQDLRNIRSLRPIQLVLKDCIVNDRQIQSLSKISTIKRLAIIGSENISQLSLSYISRMTNLDSLSVSGCHLNDEDLAVLAEMTGLQNLDLRGNERISMVGLRELITQRVAPLTISIQGCKCQDLSGEELKELSMEQLYINDARIDGWSPESHNTFPKVGIMRGDRGDSLEMKCTTSSSKQIRSKKSAG